MAWTYDSGQERMSFTLGKVAPTTGETLTGATSAKTCVVMSYTLVSGSFGASTAAGYIYVKSASGAFTAENINGSTGGAAMVRCSGDLGGGFNSLNYLRFLIGDTDTSFQLFTDNELNGWISYYTVNSAVQFTKAAAICLKALSVDPDRAAALVDKLGGALKMESVMDMCWKRAEALAG